MIIDRFRRTGWLVLALLAACSAPLKSGTVAFRPPESNPQAVNVNGLFVSVEPYDRPEQMEQTFGADLRSADVLPVLVVAKNTAPHRYQILGFQAYGVTPDGGLVTTYSLGQATERIRGSAVATKFAAKVVLGALAGAAAGVAIGAAVGGGRGAATGAAVGGALGGVTGGVLGATDDKESVRISSELAGRSFGNRQIPPGDQQLGFLFLKNGSYTALRATVRNLNDNKDQEITIPFFKPVTP